MNCSQQRSGFLDLNNLQRLGLDPEIPKERSVLPNTYEQFGYL